MVPQASEVTALHHGRHGNPRRNQEKKFTDGGSEPPLWEFAEFENENYGSDEEDR